MARKGEARLWRVLPPVFVLAVAVNYPWEMAQCPLFAGSSDFSAFWHCFVASLGDGVLILVILGAGWIVLKRPDWFARPGASGYAVMLATGLLLGISIEWTAVHILGRWAYKPGTPLIPGLEIGLLPIVQMVALPPVIFALSAFWLKSGGSLQSRKPASGGRKGSET